MSGDGDPGDPGDEWTGLVEDVLEDPNRITLLFQPVVSVIEATVVGYEALARFQPSERVWPAAMPPPPPDRWFAEADRLGFGAELESLVLRRCLAVRRDLPTDCFLTVNISPHLVTDPLINDALLSAGSLAPLILELTEHEKAPDLAPLVRLREQMSERGGFVAVDDAGSGYQGLQQMTKVRPHFIKLDRALVRDVDQDEVKLALVELLGEFAARIDSWLLAEGVETWAELEAVVRLDVPLAQGFLFGRPAPPWARLDPDTVARLTSFTKQASLVEHVAGLMEEPPFVADGVEIPDLGARIALHVDEFLRPIAVLVPQGDGLPGHRRRPVSLRVPPSASVVDVARRILARDQRYRFDPVVCIDERGRALGVLRVERVLHALLRPNPLRWPDLMPSPRRPVPDA